MSRPSRAARVIAWSGGLAFVGSLSYFLFFHTWVLLRERAVSRGVLAPLLIDVLVFAVFAAHHSLLARPPIKAIVTRWIPPSLERSSYVWIASLLFLLVCVAWQPVPGEVYRLEGRLAWAGYAIQGIGLALCLAGAAVLDVFELAGIRQAREESGTGSFRAAGPYRWVRHPVYTGWILFVFGPPVMNADRLAFAAISTIYVVIAIPWEERALLASLGATYREYQQRVRWRVLPLVY